MPKVGATVRRTDEGESVGPKMHSALVVLSSGACTSKNDLATTVGPNGSPDYGYRIVNRILSKNLAVVDPEHDDAASSGMGAVILTEKGARYLNKNTDRDPLDPDDYPDRGWSRFGTGGHWSDSEGGD